MWSAYTEQNPALRTCNSSTNAVYLNVLIVKLNSNLVINTVYVVLCNTVTPDGLHCAAGEQSHFLSTVLITAAVYVTRTALHITGTQPAN